MMENIIKYIQENLPQTKIVEIKLKLDKTPAEIKSITINQKTFTYNKRFKETSEQQLYRYIKEQSCKN